MRAHPVALTALMLLLHSGCTERRAMLLESPSGTPVWAETGVAMPRIRFGDGQISLNDRCIVRQAKLNLRMPPVYVNGKPIGFC